MNEEDQSCVRLITDIHIHPPATTVVRYWHWIHEKEKLDVIPENVWSTLDTYTYICGWPDECDAIMGREEASKREIAEKATGVEREGLPPVLLKQLLQ